MPKISSKTALFVASLLVLALVVLANHFINKTYSPDVLTTSPCGDGEKEVCREKKTCVLSEPADSTCLSYESTQVCSCEDGTAGVHPEDETWPTSSGPSSGDTESDSDGGTEVVFLPIIVDGSTNPDRSVVSVPPTSGSGSDNDSVDNSSNNTGGIGSPNPDSTSTSGSGSSSSNNVGSSSSDSGSGSSGPGGNQDSSSPTLNLAITSLSNPTINPNGSTFDSQVSFTLSTPTNYGNIKFAYCLLPYNATSTTTCDSSNVKYVNGNPAIVTINEYASFKVRARALSDLNVESEAVVSNVFTARNGAVASLSNPTFSPNGGTFIGSQGVSINGPSGTTKIDYRVQDITDTGACTSANLQSINGAGGSIVVNRNSAFKIRARAIGSNNAQSLATTSKDFAFTPSTATTLPLPVLAPNGGIHNGSLYIEETANKGVADIYYLYCVLSGSNINATACSSSNLQTLVPSASAPKIFVELDTDFKIRLRALKADGTQSDAITSSLYTFYETSEDVFLPAPTFVPTEQEHTGTVSVTITSNSTNPSTVIYYCASNSTSAPTDCFNNNSRKIIGSSGVVNIALPSNFKIFAKAVIPNVAESPVAVSSQFTYKQGDVSKLDHNGDGKVNILDMIVILRYLFSS